MTTPINLTKLRHDIRLSKDAGYPIDITAKQALALIDTAEAAIALENDIMDAIAGADLEAWNAPYRIDAPLLDRSRDRLRETLNHYTTTP
jgi:hypothetical protein